MANSTSHILPYPIKNARLTLPIGFRSTNGIQADPSGLAVLYSTNGGATFSLCAESLVTGGNFGAGYITLTGAETNNDFLWVAASSVNCVASLSTVSPRNLGVITTGTLSSGAFANCMLGANVNYDLTGCFIRTTGGTGGGGTGGANNQARKITSFTPPLNFTVSPNFETAVASGTTYDLLLPEGVTLGMLKTLNPVVPGNNVLVDSSGYVSACVMGYVNVSGFTQIAQSGLANTILSQSTKCTEQTAPSGSLTEVILQSLNSSVSSSTMTISRSDSSTFGTRNLTITPGANPIRGIQ